MLFNKYYLFIIFFLAIYSTSSHAQSGGVLKGVVQDASDKEAISGANIYDANDKTHRTITDADGNYQLNLTSGKHTIICSFISMKSDTAVVFVDSSKTTTHDFLLGLSVTELQTMVVSAGKYERKLEDITVSMEVLKSTLIENKNSSNIKSALEQTPGLNILDGEPQIRGGSGFNFGIGSRVAILIDGLPALAGDGGRPEWNFIPLENVEQVEVIKGASSVTYGSSALSGSINIRTAYPKDKPLTKVSVSSGVYDSPSVDSTKWWKGIANFSNASFLHSQKFGQTDLVLGGMFIYDHGFIGPPSYHPGFGTFNDTTIDDNEVGEKTGRLNFNLRHRSKKISQLNYGVNGNFMKATNNLSLIWDDDTSGLYRAFPHTMTLQDQKMFYLDPFINYYSNRGFKHSLRTRYFYTNNISTDNTKQVTKLSTETNVAYSEYQLTKEINKGLNITGGIIMNQTYSTSGISFKGILPHNHLQNFAGYTQVDKNMWEVLNISLGFREEAFIMNDAEVVTKPVFRSGLNLKLAQATFLRSSYGQGFRFPTITEKYIYSSLAGLTIYPNPQLEPETSWNAEIGMKQGFKINKFTGYVDFALFWQEYKNTIEFTFGVWDKNKDIFGDDSLSTGFKYLNTGPTRVKGFEVSLPGEGIVSKNLKINILGGYTFVLPQALAPSEVYAIDSTQLPMSYASSGTDTTNYILKYRFQHIAKIDLQVTYKAFFIGGDFRYYSFMQNIDNIFYKFESILHSGIEKYRNENDNGTIVVDARIGMDITKKFKVSFIANNAFNKSYSLRPLKIESPRTFAIRLSLNFGE